MRILILDTYYPAFQRAFYAAHPGLAAESYALQWRALQDACFGTADFYSFNLERLGHQAHEAVVNCDPLQLQWAREHAPRLAQVYPLAGARRRTRVVWQLAVASAQIAWYRPDVLYVQDLVAARPPLLSVARRWAHLIAGQTAYELPRGLNLKGYDLVVSSFPHYVNRFRAAGIPSAYLRIAFEPRVLARLPQDPPRSEAIFVGSYTPAHSAGVQLLERVARQVPIDFWGVGVEHLSASSPIRQSYKGEAWGLSMYGVLAGARVALNRHINVAEGYANNMRLYEATGVGTCLVTDRKSNLGELFEIDREVVAYGSAEECAEQVRYLLDHEDVRRTIAAAGQARTLREHTYAQRMEELAAILEAHLRRPGTTARSMVTLGQVRARLGRAFGRGAVSYGHRQVAADEIRALARGWQSAHIPKRQRRLVAAQLRQLRAGKGPPVFQVAADAIRATGISHPLIVELGCASAYYSEALPALLGGPIRYVGLDYSAALLRQARRHYDGLPLICADAATLPFADGCCDIAFSSGLILHVPDYRRAIAETARIARSWCIFHRTPVIPGASTTALAKYAYGVPVVELIFGEEELMGLLAASGLTVVETFIIERATLPEVQGQVAWKTYLCRKHPSE